MQPLIKQHAARSITQLPTKQEQFVKLLDEVMVLHLHQRQADAMALSSDYARVWNYIETLYRAGGKRTRPYLAYTSFQALSHDKPPIAGFMSVAIAIEFIHLAMLIHDDIIDRDTIRHGQQNMTGMYREHYSSLSKTEEVDHYANGAALLSGDALISEAYRTVMACQITPTQKSEICAIFGQTIFEVIAGELLDTEAVYLAPDQVDSRNIARLKTASYSCVMPLKVGAVLAGATTETIADITAIGTAIGIAYQIADDDLGIFGDETKTGKSSSNDLHERKRTMLLQRTLELSSPEDTHRLTEILTLPALSPALIEECRSIIIRSGARAALSVERQAYTVEALDIVSHLPVAASGATDLVTLLTSLTQRTV